VKMKLSSPVFGEKQKIPSKHTCDGANTNPPLEIADIPQGAETLVLIVDDPDAPMGDWVHWLVWNINPETKAILAGNIPEDAIEGINDFGQKGYGGPCPPSGSHRYQFKLYALDIQLHLSSHAKKMEIEQAMHGHLLEKAMLVGVYSREK
jgi:Raf kinase inhibitor-like YbhB/YbcL family protein